MSRESRSRSIRNWQVMGFGVTAILVIVAVAALLGILVGVAEEPPPKFEVEDLRPGDATVGAGEQFDVSATVTNTDESSERQFVELRIDEAVHGNVSVELEPGESETVRFESVDADEFDVGTHTYAVHTDADESTATLRIDRDPAAFLVNDVRPPNVTVDAGERFDASANVTNVGETNGTRTLELHVDDVVEANRSVELEPGESETVRFEDVDTEEFDVGTHGLSVNSDVATRTVPLTIEGTEPAEFELEELRPDDFSIESGEQFDVAANVTNVGEQTATQNVTLRIGDASRGNLSVALAPGESLTARFYNVDPGGLEGGEHEYGVYSEDDDVTATVTIEREEESTPMTPSV